MMGAVVVIEESEDLTLPAELPTMVRQLPGAQSDPIDLSAGYGIDRTP